MEIIAIGKALGEKKIDLADVYPDIDRLLDKTGIPCVFETDGDMLDLAEQAASQVLPLARDVKLLILVTQSPVDYLPANAVSLASRLNLPKNLLAFDFNQGCSGFVQSFCLAANLIEKYSQILIVTADTYRQKLQKNDRSTNAVFSDGSAAVLLSAENSQVIHYEDHMTAGQHRDFLFQSATDTENSGYLHMSGGDVWLFTLREVVPQIAKAIAFCEENGLLIKNIYIHQASKLVVEGIRKKLEHYQDLFRVNYSENGNTVSSTIPFLLRDFPLDTQGGVSIFAGFGVGLTSSIVVFGAK